MFTNLPLFEFLLLRGVLFQQVFKHLFEAVRVGLELRQDILYSSLHKYTIDHPKTLAIAWKWFECLQHKSISVSVVSVMLSTVYIYPILRLSLKYRTLE